MAFNASRQWQVWQKERRAKRLRIYGNQRRSQQRQWAVWALAGIASLWWLPIAAMLFAAACAPIPAHAASQATPSISSIPRVAIPHLAQPHRATLLRESRRVWGIAAPSASFAAQIHQESGWRTDASSPVGAVGLTQFMPATAAWMGSIQPDLAGAAPLNPTWAIRALVVYNHWLYKRLPAANACEQLAFALSAYNGGLGWALKRRARSPEPALCLGKTCNINPGITPANQAENQSYPQRILRRLEPVYAASGRWGQGACT